MTLVRAHNRDTVPLKLLKIEITTQTLAKEVLPSFLSYLVIANQKKQLRPLKILALKLKKTIKTTTYVIIILRNKNIM